MIQFTTSMFLLVLSVPRTEVFRMSDLHHRLFGDETIAFLSMTHLSLAPFDQVKSHQFSQKGLLTFDSTRTSYSFSIYLLILSPLLRRPLSLSSHFCPSILVISSPHTVLPSTRCESHLPPTHLSTTTLPSFRGTTSLLRPLRHYFMNGEIRLPQFLDDLFLTALALPQHIFPGTPTTHLVSNLRPFSGSSDKDLRSVIFYHRT